MPLDRSSLASAGLTGAAWCRAHSDVVDAWLAGLLAEAGGDRAGIALVAVGGYGRQELAPQSDIDVVLLHDGAPDVAALADRLWYPVWDEGLKLGHSVRTPKEALSLAEHDLDTATSLLTARHLAGDTALTASLAASAEKQWRKQAKWWLTQLGQRVQERHAAAGEVAFLLEPDLKEGRGGLRDVHALQWARAGGLAFPFEDDEELATAYDALLAARVALHERTGRPGNVLLLQEQDGVAEALGDESAEVLMARIAAAARRIAWSSDESWRHIGMLLRGPVARRLGRDRPLSPGIVLRGGEVHVTANDALADDPVLPLRAAAEAAAHGAALSRSTLELLAAKAPTLPVPWPSAAREELVRLLLAGPPAIAVIESLDHSGLWTRLLPEWEPVRSRPQRNAYHRFTVDRHLVEAATGAARLAPAVARPDLLVVGTLLHDIGKGYPGDHTETGMAVVRDIGARLGFGEADVDVLVAMVEHHLLLPDVAVRRDLDDPATIERVAVAVGSTATLRLLAALTEADSIATGPAAWSPWKAGLLRELVDKVAHVLAGGAVRDVLGDDLPDDLRPLVASREPHIRGDGDQLTVVVPDRPGLFSRVAGVLSLHGLGVLGAQAWSTDDGLAVERFTVDVAGGPAPWDAVVRDVERALAGRLALQARLEARAATYARRVKLAAPSTTAVSFDREASASATVIDVQAPDGIGVLYRITRALAELDLDIRSARVQTVGAQVLDAFYVCDANGATITDKEHLAEIERAVLAAVKAG